MEHLLFNKPGPLDGLGFFVLYAAGAEREQAATVRWGWHFTFRDAPSAALVHGRSPAGPRR